MRLLRGLYGVTPRRRRLLIEAAISLLAARSALRHVPFQSLASWFTRSVTAPEVTDPARALLCEDVRWAITQAARCLPGKTVCFPRALVAQSLLRRRGVDTDLYYGASFLPGEGLKTHVWLQNGDRGIVGHQEADDFHVLACYSSRRSRAASVS